MTGSTDAAKRLAAHLRRIENELATLDARADTLAEQVAAALPPMFDEAAARTELAAAVALDIANNSVNARSVAERIAAAREAAEQARQAAEDVREQAAEDLAQIRATRDALEVQRVTTADLLRSEVQRAGIERHREAHVAYLAALEAAIAAAVEVAAAGAVLDPDPATGVPRVRSWFSLTYPAFELVGLAGRVPVETESAVPGGAATLNQHALASRASQRASAIVAEITGAS